jgi:hypothetical protein
MKTVTKSVVNSQWSVASSRPPAVRAAQAADSLSRFTFHVPRSTERGVALVITLVLLSVITFMAVTFLVVSSAQRGSVTTETEQAQARLAADQARERAIVQLIAPILAWTNEFNYGLIVSTNYVNKAGFDPAAPGPVNPMNVNYDYIVGSGAALNPPQRNQNIANLLYDPRPPVFIRTNTAFGYNDFRYYLDLNRNGRPDPNGAWPVTDGRGYFYYLTSGQWQPPTFPPPDPNTVLYNVVTGDPEWIGVLQHPEYAHSSSNLFTARYAYLVVPASQTLDVNCMHNDGKGLSLEPTASLDGFLRNQGALTAELNLAAFLSDLNTNLWPNLNQLGSRAPYIYNAFSASSNPDTTPNQGVAFMDASAILRYRYATNLNSLASVQNLFPLNNKYNAFTNLVDAYCEGPLMLGTWWPPAGWLGGNPNSSTRLASPWAGSANVNRFYTPQDFFDASKFPPPAAGVSTFADRLWMAGTSNDTYNATTFYRLLSQLGTDSAPEPGGKMNLNYCNVDTNGYVVPNMVTNFQAWDPAQFFTNAAIRLLADAGYAVGAYNSTSNILTTTTVNGMLRTNLAIRIWPTNYYTPSVHRLLQLAANLYDATTNRTDLAPNVTPAAPYFPTVFRPIFTGRKGNPNPYFAIVGYREINAADLADITTRYDLVRDLSDTNDFKLFNPNTDMAYNIPLVIGAKKGFPNFNKFAMYTAAQVTRKLQYHRQNDLNAGTINEIDQMFVVGISNVLGVDAWNSYQNPYPRQLQIYVWPDISLYLTNLETGHCLNGLTRWRQLGPVTTNLNAYTWPGYVPNHEKPSFVIPLHTNVVFLSNMTYQASSDSFIQLTGNFERNRGSTNFHLPRWQVTIKPRVRFAVVDAAANRLIDYVNLADINTQDLTGLLAQGGRCGTSWIPDGSDGSMWCTNKDAAADWVATYGIRNQIEVSMGPPHVSGDWSASTQEFPAGMSITDAQQFFKQQFLPTFKYLWTNSFNTPFQPFRTVFLMTSWEVNDPLVHYTTGDLVDVGARTISDDQFDSTSPSPVDTLGSISARYAPWGWQAQAVSASTATSSSGISPWEMAVKDPVSVLDWPAGRSDAWDFPTNKFANVGWVGRVHRGTPWQTVYLKPSGFDPVKWQQWSGNPVVEVNVGQFVTNIVPLNAAITNAYFTQPTNDWRLLDLFTAALNDNATRGQLSVNQSGLAAWSALLSGVITLTNFDASGNAGLFPKIIDPAGCYDSTANPATWPALAQLVKRINDVRATNNARHVFIRLSDILAVPELTVASPFINTTMTAPGKANYALNDAAIERIPQQIAGLLKVDTTPRFVIYAFGQTLKPALRNPKVTSGAFAGLCTNYQIVAEAATRTVVRFDGVQPYPAGTPPAINNLHPVIESFNVLPPD